MRDLDAVFAKLADSSFRRRFHLGPKEAAYLQQRGLTTILDHAADFISLRVAPAHPVNDGKQTPMRGHPAFIAQHATATCCRTCIAKWHDIETGRELTTVEETHILKAIERWLKTGLG